MKLLTRIPVPAADLFLLLDSLEHGARGLREYQATKSLAASGLITGTDGPEDNNPLVTIPNAFETQCKRLGVRTRKDLFTRRERMFVVLTMPQLAQLTPGGSVLTELAWYGDWQARDAATAKREFISAPLAILMFDPAQVSMVGPEPDKLLEGQFVLKHAIPYDAFDLSEVEFVR